MLWPGKNEKSGKQKTVIFITENKKSNYLLYEQRKIKRVGNATL